MVAERTIEELLGLDNEKLQKLSPEELAAWVGDSLTRQEELLASAPRTRPAGAPRVNPGTAAKQRAVEQNMKALPPELQEIAAQAQALMKVLKK